MKQYLAGFATAYLVGAVGATVSTWHSPEMSPTGMAAERLVLGVTLAVLWPWHAYLVINEWDS